MIFDVITLFPGMFASPLQASILGRAIDQGLLQVRAHNLRDWAEDKHRTTDAPPYGGGDGMVMKPEPVARAVAAVREVAAAGSKVLLMTPQGRPFRQQDARNLAHEAGLIFICGRYEGFDERVRLALVDDELSLGDFVVTGGELPALVMIDAIARHLPGVLGAQGSAEDDSFSEGLLEYPQYTRPADFKGMTVPEVLLSGDHGRIAAWRREQQLIRTWQRRPELLANAALSGTERALLEQFAEQQKTGDPSKTGGASHEE